LLCRLPNSWGEERKQIADKIDTSWYRAVGAILVSGLGMVFNIDGIGKLYKAYRTPLAVKRIVRGREFVDTLVSGNYKNLKVSQKKDLYAFIINARKKELAHGILDETEKAALKAIKNNDGMGVMARGASTDN